MPDAAIPLPPGYAWQPGASSDREALLATLQAAYREQFPEQDYFAHLAATVASYFAPASPLWWLLANARQRVGCLWLGRATDQVSGDRYTHIFLLYVEPAHRRRGLGTALLQQAQAQARAQGDRQLGLHVFARNQAAQQFYQQQGCQTQSLLMVKKLV